MHPRARQGRCPSSTAWTRRAASPFSDFHTLDETCPDRDPDDSPRAMGASLLILFFLPWLGHTLVGTTDAPSAAETRPTAPEDEVQWLLNECSRYLSPDVRVSRKDVLSAWRGWSRRGVPPRVRTERARASENSNGVGRAGDPSRATLMQRPARPRRCFALALATQPLSKVDILLP